MKNQNSKMEYWRQFLKTDIHNDKQLLIKNVRNGIPSAMRMQAWGRIVNLQKMIKQSKFNYNQLIKSKGNQLQQQYIELDIPRTYPKEENHKALQKSLFNVLKAISIAYPKIGYKSGMSFLIYRLLQIINDQNAFWIFCFIIQNNLEFKLIFQDRSKCRQINSLLANQIKIHFSKLYDIFKQQNQMEIIFCTDIMTLFSYHTSPTLFLRIFDMFLVEGFPIMISCCLSILKQKQKQLLTFYNSGKDQFYLKLFQLSKLNTIQSQELLFADIIKYNLTSQILKK